MFKLRGTKVVALMLVMLFAVSSNVMCALADQNGGGEAQAVTEHVGALPAEDDADSSTDAADPEIVEEAETPAEPETPDEPQTLPDIGSLPVFTPQRVVYTVTFLDPDGGEYFILELEEYERLELPLFTPELENHTFEYWYEEVPIDPDQPALGMTEAEIPFGIPIGRNYIIHAKMVEIPVVEAPAPQPEAADNAEKDNGGESAEPQQQEAPPKQTRDARRDQRQSEGDEPQTIGSRSAGDVITMDDLEIIIIEDTDPILDMVEDGTNDVIPVEDEGEEEDEGDYDAIIVDDEDETTGEEPGDDESDDTVIVDEEEEIIEEEETAGDETTDDEIADEESDEAVIVDEEEEIIGEEETAGDETTDEETDEAVIDDKEEEIIEEEETAGDETTDDEIADEETEETVIVDEEEEVIGEEETAGEAGDELDMPEEEVPLAGWAVNVHTSHQPFMLEGETLDVWAELIGFDHVDVLLQWQYSGDDGIWHNAPGATGLSYSLIATKETVNYTWRLAVAVAGN